MAVRLDAVMVASNKFAAGFPPLLPEPRNPAIYYTKKIETEESINNSCYICHDRGHRLVTDYWEYDPITGAGPFRTLYSGTLTYHSETNGSASDDCSSIRTGPSEWSDPTCGFSTSNPDQILVSNRTAFSYTLVLSREEHGLAMSPRGTARRDVSERSRLSIDVYDPYSLDDFLAEVEEGVRSAPWPDWTQAARNGWAERGGRSVINWINDDLAEFNATLTKLKYRIAVRGPRDEKRMITWVERFAPNGGGPVQDTRFTEQVTCTGAEQFLVAAGGEQGRKIDPPPAAGRIDILLLSEWSCDDETCSPGSGRISTGSIDLKISLGKTVTGESAGFLALKEDAPGTNLASPRQLQYFVNHDVEILQDGPDLRQIKAPQTFALIHPLAAGYEILFYSGARGKDNHGYYLPAGSPEARWQIEQPDQDPGRLRVTRFTGSAPLISEFTWSSADHAWALVIGDLRKEIRSATEANGFRTETFVIRALDDRPVRQEIRRWRQYGGLLGDLLVYEQIGGPDNPLITTWTYYEDPLDRARFGQLKSVLQPDGAQQSYDYDSAGRLKTLTVPFANLAQGRVFEYSYAPIDPLDDGTRATNSPRTVVEKVLGHEVSRAYHSVRPDATLEVLGHHPGAPFDAPENLVTVIRTLASPNDSGTVETAEYADGTLRIRHVSSEQSGQPRTIQTAFGQPNAEHSGVVDGTQTDTSLDAAGRIVSRQITDVQSGTVLAGERYSYPDPFGPPDRVLYLDGTSSASVHDCCHPQRVVDVAGTPVAYSYDPLGRISALTRAGIAEGYTYDAAGQILQVSRQGTNGTTMILRRSTFDLAGREIQFSDALGNTTVLQTEYPPGGGTVRTTVYPDGGVRRESLGVDGSVLAISGSATRPLAYEYGVELVEGVPELFVKESRTTSAGAAEWTKTYHDFLGRPAQVVRSDGGTRELFYNAAGQLRKVRDFDGCSMLYAYNQKGEREYVALDVNNSDTIDLNGDDRIVRVVRDVANGRSRTRTYVWPHAGQDEAELVDTVETSLDGRSRTENRFGQLTASSTQPMGQGVERQIDQAADGSVTTREYQHGLLQTWTKTGAGGEFLERMEYHYDAHGRLEKAVDHSRGLTTSYESDEGDRLMRTAARDADDALTLTTALRYDPNGRIREFIYPDGSSRSNAYTMAGQLRQTSGARIYPVDYDYDDQGRLLTDTIHSAAGAGQTRWAYDNAGGWVSARVLPDGTQTSFARSPGSMLQSSTSGRGIVTSYAYNAAGDLEALTHSSSGMDSFFLQFDRRGLPSRIQHGPHAIDFEYHVSGQWQAQIAEGLEIRRQLDAAGRPALVAIGKTAPAATLHEAAITYDGASRITGVRSGPMEVEFRYGANSSQLVDVSYRYQGLLRLEETRGYDGFQRPRHFGSAPANAPALVFDYGYDQAGRQTNATETDGAWTFGYDGLGQLTSAGKHWKDGVAAPGQQFEYVYDTAGNRLQTRTGGTLSGSPLRLAKYSVNNLNQYVKRDVPGILDLAGTAPVEAQAWINGQLASRHHEDFHLGVAVNVASGPSDPSIIAEATLQNSRQTVRGHRLLPRTPETFAYDADGNLIQDGLWSLVWDAENRLIGLETHPQLPAASRLKLAFEYDHLGRRIAKTVWSWNESTAAFELSSQRRFVYEDWRLLAELNETNELVRAFVWGPDVSGSGEGAGGIGGLVGLIEAGRYYFYAHDGHGNIRAVIAAEDGTCAARYDYGPFGELVRATGPMARSNPFRFSTKYQDNETDFLYFGERYYAPSLGRWLSRDPLGESAGPNLYAYVGNAPNLALDPLGLDVVYLLDPNALNIMGHPSGHTGLLIGNDRTGWHYFSFSSGKCLFNPYGGNRADNLDYRGFNTLADARRDPGLARYQKYALWQTDSAADRKALETARKFFNKRYNICTQTCDDLAAQALQAAGVQFDDRWRPVDSYDANKDKADDHGTFPQPAAPQTK